MKKIALALTLAGLLSGSASAATDPMAKAFGKPSAVSTSIAKDGSIYSCRTWRYTFKGTKTVSRDIVDCIYIGRQGAPKAAAPKKTVTKPAAGSA